MASDEITMVQEITEGDLYSLDIARRKVKYGNPEVPIFLWGPPGIGKTTMVHEVAHELYGKESKTPILDVRLAQIESIDLRGLLMATADDKYAVYKIVKDVLPIPEVHGERGIFFADEFNLAELSVMKAAYQLLTEKRLGSYVFPKGWKMVFAGNNPEDAPSMINEVAKPLASRFQHVRVDPPSSESQTDSMFRWYYRNGIHPSIIAFLKTFPTHIYDPKVGDVEKGWPNPRAWHNVSKQINTAGMGLIVPDTGELNIRDESSRMWLLSNVADNVGTGAARAFVEYVAIYDRIPDPIMILEKGVSKACDVSTGGKPFPSESQIDLLHALSTSVVSHMTARAKSHGRNGDDSNMSEMVEHFYEFLTKLPVDLRVKTMQDVFYIPELLQVVRNSSHYRQFCAENYKMITL